MNGMIIFTVETVQFGGDIKAKLDTEVAGLGFKTTMACSEGGEMSLPGGTYVWTGEIQDGREKLKDVYRSLVSIMGKLGAKGKYFISMANKPVSSICGEL